jgi:hypothetical protein
LGREEGRENLKEKENEGEGWGRKILVYLLLFE